MIKFGTKLSAHPFCKRRDARGYETEPTRMIRLVLERGAEKVSIDLRPADLQRIVNDCLRVPDAGLQEEGQIGDDRLHGNVNLVALC